MNCLVSFHLFMKNPEPKDQISKMIKILSGEMAIELHLQFLIRNNNTDLMILKNTKVRGFVWICLIHSVICKITATRSVQNLTVLAWLTSSLLKTQICFVWNTLTFKTRTCEAREELIAPEKGCVIKLFQIQLLWPNDDRLLLVCCFILIIGERHWSLFPCFLFVFWEWDRPTHPPADPVETCATSWGERESARTMNYNILVSWLGWFVRPCF